MRFRALSFLLIFACLNACVSAAAQAGASRVVSPANDAVLFTLEGNTHLLARSAPDQGPVAPSLSLSRMLLVLKRSPDQEAELKHLIDQQQDRRSSNYHHWLTPQSFGLRFGPSDHDLSATTDWLASHQFTDIRVNAGRTLIEFSGTAGDVQSAFHTRMRRYLVGGKTHVANASDPRIPAALAPVIAGVASLDDFAGAQAAAAVNLRRDRATGAITHTPGVGNVPPTADRANPDYTTSSFETVYAVTPYDFATIYNVNPLWSTGVDGTGQTIAVVGQSDLNAADFVNFRNLFHLPVGDTTGPTQTQYLNIIYNGSNPGLNEFQGKGDSDTQWSGAIAKGATIDYVVTQTTETSQGSDLSAVYAVDNNLAPVLVDTYFQCERTAGNSYNSFISNLWQQAAAQGITVVAAAGDNGSAGCDVPPTAAATGGLAVNAVASTPYNVSVGGTDFYLPNGGSAYWSSTNDPTTHASAKGYVPETVWNDSCTNPNLSTNLNYSGLTPEQVCNSSAAAQSGLLTVRGGAGGTSRCSTSSGTSCVSGYGKPSWQTGAGVPSDQVRDLPDISLFAGDGNAASFYFLCEQSAVSSGSCNLGTPSTDFVGAGGTSFSAAAFAGIMALVNQKQSSQQGNANYTLYALAKQQQTAGTSCNATGSPAASCIFNDITSNTNAMPCVSGSPNCTTTTSGDRYGILSGYRATAAYDQASGLGSVNVANLVNGWHSVVYAATTTKLALSPTTVVHGTPVTTTVDVTSSSGTPTGLVSINAATSGGSIGVGTLTAGVYTGQIATFPGGTYPVHAYYGGDGTFAASESVPVNLTVTPENSTSTLKVTDQNGQLATNVPYGDILTFRADVGGLSGKGTPTGNVNFTDSGAGFYGTVYRLNSAAYAEFTNNALPVRSYNLAVAYVGDPSFDPSNSAVYILNVNKAATSAAIAASTTTVSDAANVTFTVTIGTSGFGAQSPGGTVTLTSGGVTVGTATLQGQPTNGTSFDFSIATVSIPADLLTNGSPVVVTYPGDANYLASSAQTAPLVISPSGLPTSGTSLIVTPMTVAPGGSVTLTASVASMGAPVTGTVQFLIDTQNVGTAASVTSGSASQVVSIAGLSTGTHVAAAIYSGDPAHQSSRSGQVPFTIGTTIGTTASATSISVSPMTVVQGAIVLVQATASPKTPAPTGTFKLLIDGSSVGSLVTLDASSSGSFSIDTTTIQPGKHTVQVFYSGDATYSTSTSALSSFIVTIVPATVTAVALSGVPQTVGAGTVFPFTVTVSPSAPTPTGTFQVILDSGSPMPAVNVTGDPQNFSFDTTGLSNGGHTLSVFYSGNTNYPAATSPPVSFTILSVNTSFTLTPAVSTARIYFGRSVSNAIVLSVNPASIGIFSVTLACTSGMPPGVSCIFNPATVNINGTASSTTTLTVVDANLAQFHQRREFGRPGWFSLGGSISLAGLLLLLTPRRSRRVASLFAMSILLALGAISGCGSGIEPSQGPFPITVTATSGSGIQASATAAVTVNLTIGGAP